MTTKTAKKLTLCERCHKHRATWRGTKEAAFGVIISTSLVCGWCKRKMGGA